MAEFASAKGQPVPTETVVSSISKLAGLDATALEEATAERQRAFIRERYGASAAGRAAGCCDDGAAGCCDDVAGPTPMPAGAAPKDFAAMSEAMGYSTEQVKGLGNLGLGCGNPFTDANIVPGETVLDLGSGAGFDCFLASKMVGADGRVIGVDMTQEMITTSRANASEAVKQGLPANTSFRLGEIEYLPVADNSVDCIISNCVVNLSMDQPQVYKEAFRVLKPGELTASQRLCSLSCVAHTPVAVSQGAGSATRTSCSSATTQCPPRSPPRRRSAHESQAPPPSLSSRGSWRAPDSRMWRSE